MTYWQNIENLLLIQFIKSSHILDDSDEDFDNENDSEEEENDMIFLGLSSLLDSRYSSSRTYNVVKSQEW